MNQLKIELKLTADAICVIRQLLDSCLITSEKGNTEFLFSASIATDVREKFDKKERSLPPATTTRKKRLKMTLKYHEAYALEYILRISRERIDNNYSRMLITDVAAQLHQILI